MRQDWVKQDCTAAESANSKQWIDMVLHTHTRHFVLAGNRDSSGALAGNDVLRSVPWKTSLSVSQEPVNVFQPALSSKPNSP